MRLKLGIIAVLGALCLPSAQVLAKPQPSFLCSEAISDAQKAICFSEELSQLDIRMARAYQSVLAGAIDKAATKKEQKQWLAKRDDCESAECIKAIYIDRIAALTTKDAAAKKAGTYVVANVGPPPEDFLRLQSDLSTAKDRTISKMPAGTALEVLQRQVDGWVHVKRIDTGQVGWAFSGTSQKRTIVWQSDKGDGIDASRRTGGTYIIANTVAPKNYLELRSETSETSGRVIARLANGTEVKILQRGVTGWVHLQVAVSRQTGWVNAGSKDKALIQWRPAKQQPDLPKVGRYVVANTLAPSYSVPLRAQPLVSSDNQIGTLPNDTELRVLQPNVQGWVFVQVIRTGQKGWVFSGTDVTRYIVWRPEKTAQIDAATRKGGTYIIANTVASNNFLPMYSDTSTTTGRMIAKLANGTAVQILQRDVTGWVHLQVTNSRQKGWVNVGNKDPAMIIWRPDPPKTGSYVIANQLAPKFSATLRATPYFAAGNAIVELPNGTPVLVLKSKIEGWVPVQVVATGQKGFVFSNTLDKPYIVWQDTPGAETLTMCNAQNLRGCSNADLCYAINVVVSGSPDQKQALQDVISQGPLRLNPVFLAAFNGSILAGMNSDSARIFAKSKVKNGDRSTETPGADSAAMAVLRAYYQTAFANAPELTDYISEALRRPFACPKI